MRPMCVDVGQWQRIEFNSRQIRYIKAPVRPRYDGLILKAFKLQCSPWDRTLRRSVENTARNMRVFSYGKRNKAARERDAN